ncbi:hypothetical protein VYU27_000145 [Nannochloropsis oceanica]
MAALDNAAAMDAPPQHQEDAFAAFRNAKHDPARREHLIILTAIEEMIRERKHLPSPSFSHSLPSANEYFAAIMTALEANDQSHTPELVCLLDAIMGHVDKSILRGKCKSISAVLTLLLKINLEHEMTAFVRDLVACLGKLLLAQEVSSAAWSSPGLLKTFFGLLSCFREKRPKVRKAAMQATVELLRLHAEKKVWVLGKQVTEFSGNVLEACTASDCVPTLHLLGFLQEALPFMPEEGTKKLAERLLALQGLDNSLVLQASLHALRALVKAQEPKNNSSSSMQQLEREKSGLSSAFLLQLSMAVLGLQPKKQDVGVCRAFCELIATCMECQAKRGAAAEARQQLLPRTIQALVARCETEAGDVHEAACLAMRLCLASVADNASLSNPQDRKFVAEALAAVGKLLDYRYQRAWNVCLPFFGSLFIHYRQEAGGLLSPLLKKMAFLRDAVATSSPELVKPFESCVASAIEGMGIERVLDVLPLMDITSAASKDTTPAAGTAARRAVWLLPLLASHGKREPGRLTYFHGTLLQLARQSHEVVVAETASAKQLQLHRQRVLQIWGLLPAFCSYPLDIQEGFGPLAPALANALQDARYPELLFTVCQGLQVLLQSVQDAAAGPKREADLMVLSATSKKFLPTLFNILDGCDLEDSVSGAKVKALSDTISAYALVAPPTFVGKLFKKLVQKMLVATQDEDGMEEDGAGKKKKPSAYSSPSNHKAVILCELALALVPSLDAAGIALLYRIIRPLIRLDRDVALQKRAYRVLGALCEHHGDRFLGQADTREELVPVLTDSLLTCHVSARQMRLRVLGAVVKTLDGNDPAQWDMLAGLVGEVLLCLKDANGKAREAAYQVLTAMAQVKEEEENMEEFSQVVLAALAAETPHMRSAAVLALAHLVFEFGPQRPAFRATIPELLSTVLMLGVDPVKEVVKAVVSFVRICVAACPLEGLEPLLPSVLETLFASNSKMRFRAKIKIILKKLCRKFGYGKILALAPVTDRRLITHIQKQALRGDRISSNAAAAGMGGGMSGKRLGNNLVAYEDEEEDDDDKQFEYLLGEGEDEDEKDEESEEEDEEGGQGVGKTMAPFSRRKLRPGEAAELKERRKAESQGLMVRDSGIIDLLDSSMIQNLKLRGGKGGREGGREEGGRARKRFRDEEEGSADNYEGESGEGDDDDEVLEFNEQGRLVVHDAVIEETNSGKLPATPKGMNYTDMMAEDAVESDEQEELRKGQKGFGGTHKRQRGADGKPKKEKHRNVSRKEAQQQQQQRNQRPGTAYQSKKAGGDVKREGQLEPYAYIPLNAKTLLSKKTKGEAAASFGAVVGNNKQRKEEQEKRGGRKNRKSGRR